MFIKIYVKVGKRKNWTGEELREAAKWKVYLTLILLIFLNTDTIDIVTPSV